LSDSKDEDPIFEVRDEVDACKQIVRLQGCIMVWICAYLTVSYLFDMLLLADEERTIEERTAVETSNPS